MDLADPLNPVSVGYYDTDEQIQDMKIAEPYLLTVSLSQFRVYQVDALNASHPRKEVPYAFALRPCYPNPFNSSTRISFTLPRTGEAVVKV